MRTRTGPALAFAAAVISGVAVFVNGYGVRSFPDPALYTTAKNLVAAVVLGIMLIAATRRGRPDGFTRPSTAAEWSGLAFVAVIGGSVPFVLFFEG